MNNQSKPNSHLFSLYKYRHDLYTVRHCFYTSLLSDGFVNQHAFVALEKKWLKTQNHANDGNASTMWTEISKSNVTKLPRPFHLIRIIIGLWPIKYRTHKSVVYPQQPRTNIQQMNA